MSDDLTTDQLVLDRARYAAQRKTDRARVMALRKSRRVQVGKYLALEFENVETLRYQAQEMVYVEGITDPRGAAEEVETYRRLLPTDHTITATMFLEFDDLDTVRQSLDGMSGVQNQITLRIGDSAVAAEDVPPPDEANFSQTYSVHFLRFTLTDEQRAAFADAAVAVRLSVEHPKYHESAIVSDETRAQLLADLDLA